MVSDFGLTKPDFARISKEEMRMLEEKIKTLKIPKIHWFRYLKTTHYSEEKIKHTPKKIKEMLEKRHAKSVKIVTLLDKEEGRVFDMKADYSGFKIPNAFVV